MTEIRIAIVIPFIYSSQKLLALKNVLKRVSISAKRSGSIELAAVLIANRAPQTIVQNPPNNTTVMKNNRIKRLHFLWSSVNRGFSQAVNDGMLFAKYQWSPDWYLILNDDAFVSKRFFEYLIPQLASRLYDALSCRVLSPKGTTESVGLWYSPSGVALPRTGDKRPTDTPIFTGVCTLLARKRVEKELANHGYVFNPLLFAYSEDLELSLRILRDGGKIHIDNDPLVTHLGSQTAKRGSFMQLSWSYRHWLAVILLHWSTREILTRLPFLLLGQIYIFSMSMYKGYWLLYPKIWWWIIQNRDIILWQRRQYGTT